MHIPYGYAVHLANIKFGELECWQAFSLAIKLSVDSLYNNTMIVGYVKFGD